MATTTNNGWETPDDTDLVKDGALAIRTLGEEIDTSVGEGLLAWTSYTPTFTNLTLGNGTISFAYAKLGKTVQLRGQVTLGTTSSVSGAIKMSLPVTAVTAGNEPIVGSAYIRDPGVSNSLGVVRIETTSLLVLNVIRAEATFAYPSGTSATVPFTWGNTDNFSFYATYEGA